MLLIGLIFVAPVVRAAAVRRADAGPRPAAARRAAVRAVLLPSAVRGRPRLRHAGPAGARAWWSAATTTSAARRRCRRWCSRWCSTLTLATTGLLLLVALFTVRRRTLHDLASGLVVVRARALTRGARVLEHARRIALRMSYKPPRRPQFFYTTAPLPCPYLAGRTERKVVTEITGPEADGAARPAVARRLPPQPQHRLRAGVPVLPGLHPDPHPGRHASSPTARCAGSARANALLEGFEVPARATAEQFQLFQRYQQARHGDGDMATMSFYDYRAMVEDTPIETFIVEFRDPDDRMVARAWPTGWGTGCRRSTVLRAGAGAAVARHLRHPVADRARAGPWGCRTSISAIGCRRAARWPTSRASARPRCWRAAPGGC